MDEANFYNQMVEMKNATTGQPLFKTLTISLSATTAGARSGRRVRTSSTSSPVEVGREAGSRSDSHAEERGYDAAESWACRRVTGEAASTWRVSKISSARALTRCRPLDCSLLSIRMVAVLPVSLSAVGSLPRRMTRSSSYVKEACLLPLPPLAPLPAFPAPALTPSPPHPTHSPPPTPHPTHLFLFCITRCGCACHARSGIMLLCTVP